jgi:beta-phosphoglucomutase-like phosphatase (HAD superfamily)
MLQAGCTPRILFTSTGTDKAVHRLKTAGIYDLVSHVLGGDQVTHGKPDPEIYLKVATKAGVSAEDCAAFEDSDPGTALSGSFWCDDSTSARFKATFG